MNITHKTIIKVFVGVLKNKQPKKNSSIRVLMAFLIGISQITMAQILAQASACALYTLSKSIAIIFLLGITHWTIAQAPTAIQKEEAKYYKIVDVPIPDDVILEVGGLALTDDDKLGVSTRRGEVWLIDS
ncbi:MAG: hypothetical protein NWS46_04380, partial [Cyclobacteriaceae bacterium]|nr:hypothetical protein [Cyclobacteriaceae bacterium]